MKWTIAAVLCLAFTIRTSGQTQNVQKPPEPVVVTSDYYAQPKVLVLHAFNNSGKDITGYTFVIRHKNPDGTLDKRSRGEHTTDMLNVLITAQMAKDPTASEHIRQQNIGQNALYAAGNGIFVAGETRDMTLTGINSSSELDITYGVVFYADTTFDEQSAEAFKRMLANRQKELLVMKKTDAAIKNALADQSNDHPAAVAIAELTKAAIEAATHKPDGPYDPEQNLQWSLQNGIQNLQHIQQPQKGKTERERLTQYVEEQEKRIELMTPHSHLEITPSQYGK